MARHVQEMFTCWELNFNVCSLANESKVQVCSLLHSVTQMLLSFKLGYAVKVSGVVPTLH